MVIVTRMALYSSLRHAEALNDTPRPPQEFDVLDKALTVAAAKAKMTGLVIAAAALGGTAVAAGSTAFVPTSGDEPVATTTTETSAPEATPEATTEATPEATAEATTEATRTPLPCPTDVKNHGQYVSQVAHDKSVKGREHGKAVSEAAHSDCGKNADDSTEAEDVDSEDVDSEAPEVEESEAPDSDDAADTEDAAEDENKTDKHGNGRGRS